MISIEKARELRLKTPSIWRNDFIELTPKIQNKLAPLAVVAEDRNGYVWLLHDEKARKDFPRDIDNLRYVVRSRGVLSGLKLADPVVIQNLLESLGDDESIVGAGDSPELRLFLDIVSDGLSKGASDIHFIPSMDVMRVTNRVNGILQESVAYPIDAAKRAIEAGAHLSGDRKGASDENKIENLSIRNYEFDTAKGPLKATLRIGKSGSAFGPHKVIRLFPLKAPPSISTFGLSSHVERTLVTSMQSNQGVVMIVGPTGSGKSTTLNALYDTVGDDRMVQLICDPIETDFSHRNNFVMKSVDDRREGAPGASALTYKNLIKTALRQDPDILGIAEMRDAEVAQRVFEAGLTAHLVATTYHANDPFNAIVRLLEEGLSPIVLSETILCISSQRLIPRVCHACALEGVVDGVPFRVRNIEGCSECEAGSTGRVLVDEALDFPDDIRELLSEQAPIGKIRKTAIEKGYKTMQESARELIKQGLVCPLDAQTIVGGVYDANTHEKLLLIKRDAAA